MNGWNRYFKKGTAAFLITSSLSLGSAGPAVKELQIILNSDQATRVAQVGAGSPGNETQYFGPATRAAVIKFQNKYAADILTPARISFGNGFVGPYTIKKLNSITVGSQIGANSQNTANFSQNNSNSSPEVTANERVDIFAADKRLKSIQDAIYSAVNQAIASQAAQVNVDYNLYTSQIAGMAFTKNLSTRQATPNSKLVITGTGFTDVNDVYFGPNYIVRKVNLAAGALTVSVPPIPPGRYDIVVRNSLGNVSTSLPFVVSSSQVVGVRVDTISPAEAKYGDTITITGSGFSSQGNEVVTEMGTISNLSSSDGKTLSFVFAPESIRENAKIGNGQYVSPVGVGVISQNGMSPEIKYFKLRI